MPLSRLSGYMPPRRHDVSDGIDEADQFNRITLHQRLGFVGEWLSAVHASEAPVDDIAYHDVATLPEDQRARKARRAGEDLANRLASLAVTGPGQRDTAHREALIDLAERFLGPHRSVHTVGFPKARLTDPDGHSRAALVADASSGSLELTPDYHRAVVSSGMTLPLLEWREPTLDVPVDRVLSRGYSSLEIRETNKVAHNEGKHSNLKRYRLDVWRARMAEFLDLGHYVLNARRILQTDKRLLAYRIDARSPAELRASDGFGASRQIAGIHAMIAEPVLIGSASLRGSDRLFGTTIPSIKDGDVGSYQYAIDVQDVVTASWAEHFALSEHLHPHGGKDFMLSLDELHMDASSIKADRIYLIGSSDRRTAQRLEQIFAEDGMSGEGIWGVPIGAYR